MDYEELLLMFTKNPNILSFSEEKIIDRVLRFKNIGISKADIVASPKVFSVPKEEINIRYIQQYFLTNIDSNIPDKTLINSLMTHEGRTWARIRHLKMEKLPLDRSLIYAKESIFEKRTGKRTAELMRKYPFGDEQRKILIDRYHRENPNSQLDDRSTSSKSV